MDYHQHFSERQRVTHCTLFTRTIYSILWYRIQPILDYALSASLLLPL